MTNYVIRNQTPHHLELRGPVHTLKLSPLQRRSINQDPRTLYGDAARAARRDQAFDWEPEPTRSTVLRVASAFAAAGLVGVLLAAAALLLRRPLLGVAVACVAVLALLGSAVAVSRGHHDVLAHTDALDDEAEPARAHWGFTELIRDLTISSLQYSAFLILVVVGIAAPAAALWFGTDLSHAVSFGGGRVQLTSGDEAHHVLVVRCLQLVLVVLVSMVPALMYFQFDREKLTTLVDRWLHVIFRLDPSVGTVADVDAKYGRRVEEFLGASLSIGGELPSKRLRDRSPVVLSTLLIALGWIIVVLSVPTTGSQGAPASVPEMFHPLLTPVTMGFLGAYFLAVQVALRGFVRGDLKPKTYNVITVRILMAVVLAWALQALAGDGTAVLAAAFLGGVVPSTVLLMVRAATGRGATNDGELDQRSPLTQLDEIDVYERTRLEEEGITSVQALARHDLVDLMLSSRIPAPRLIDWVDQAMLQQHTTAALTTRLRAHGVRCATDLLQVCAHEQALADLTAALDGSCTPTLLRVVLERDEWLDYIRNWRENEDVNDRTTCVYSATVSSSVHHQVLPDIDLREHAHRIPTVHAQTRRTPEAAAPASAPG